jgi:Na+-transporting NADH:ubiquinone oxidoreductase subunit NqrD
VLTPIYITQAAAYGLMVLGALFIIGALIWFIRVRVNVKVWKI